MTTQQADLTAGRILRLTIAGDRLDGPDDGVTTPDVTMSPVTSTGLKTTGFLMILKEPSEGAAVPDGADDTFLVTVWIRNPVTQAWGAGEPTAIGYNQAFTTGDIDAAELFFQFGDVGGEGGGVVDLHFAEQ